MGVLIRPASHMPLAEMMMAPDLMRFSAIDSSTVRVKGRVEPLGMALPQRQQRACLVVQELLMLPGDRGHFVGHRRINEDLQSGQPALPAQID